MKNVNDIEVKDFIEIKTLVPREVLENVCVTALEGGSNYWYMLSDVAIDLIRKAVPKNEDAYLSTAILKAVLDYGVDVPINDAENEDDVLGYLSKKSLADRLQTLSSDEKCKWALENELNDNGDADSSDVVFQYLVMGEVVFG
jgi:hypothetical protein